MENKDCTKLIEVATLARRYAQGYLNHARHERMAARGPSVPSWDREIRKAESDIKKLDALLTGTA